MEVPMEFRMEVKVMLTMLVNIYEAGKEDICEALQYAGN
jgi:hypothetical protein